jgi:hypothetical protein
MSKASKMSKASQICEIRKRCNRGESSDPAFPFLGVNFTPSMNGEVKLDE